MKLNHTIQSPTRAYILMGELPSTSTLKSFEHDHAMIVLIVHSLFVVDDAESSSNSFQFSSYFCGCQEEQSSKSTSYHYLLEHQIIICMHVL